MGLTFADDANFIDSCDDLEDMKHIILRTVQEFKSFCDRLNIKLNVSKTFYLNDQAIDLDLKIDDDKINHQEKMNMLGIRMTSTLNTGPQVHYVKQKVKAVRYILRTFGRIAKSEQTQATIVKSFVVGSFNHGSAYLQAWKNEEYNSFQRGINGTLNFRSGKILKKELENGLITDRTIKSAVERSVARCNKI